MAHKTNPINFYMKVWHMFLYYQCYQNQKLDFKSKFLHEKIISGQK